MRSYFGFIILVFFLLIGCKKDSNTKPSTGNLQLVSVYVGNEILSFTEQNNDLPLDQPIVIRFSQALDKTSAESAIQLYDNQDNLLEINISFLDEDKTISILPANLLNESQSYTLNITNEIKGINEEEFPGLSLIFTTLSLPLEVIELKIDGEKIESGARIQNISFNPIIEVSFSEKIEKENLESNASIVLGSLTYNFETTAVSDSVYTFKVTDDLPYYRKIKFIISSDLSAEIGKDFQGLAQEFYTQLDSTNKFPEISDEELLTLIQEQTFKYFWDFAHPTSGLTRERNTSVSTVTSGGSGFGLMAILVGIERGFITHTEGISRLSTMIDFLASAERFHGAWSHWLNGETGEAIPFSSDDDGGDLVETAYTAMGLVTVRQYLDSGDSEENELIGKINNLLDEIEWTWYTQDENSLTWHWSPNYDFEKNMKIRGWDEALITYVMAASSTDYSITKEVYDEGWAGGSSMVNGNQFYDIILPLGQDYGGPMFFEHYSFTGLDPRNLVDRYANYWEQTVNHTLINRAYCVDNPINYIGYSEYCWGLTASDGNNGYSAHAPGNDRGVITPSAAVSSLPYTPDESMDVIRHFYYTLGDRLWGEYGFYDAFNVTENWYASSYIAIDQGPIILMIENYRTGLLWDLFMSAPEIQGALTKLGFTF